MQQCLSFLLIFLFLASQWGISPAFGADDRDADAEPLDFGQDLEDLLSTELISIHSRQAQTIDQVPNIVTIITGDEIRHSGAQTLGEMLSQVPGIEMRRGTITGTGTTSGETIIMRGVVDIGANSHILIMINGHRLNNIQDGGTTGNLPLIPLYHVKRIEIIRGPGSSRYGTGAFTGVINIITQDGGDLRGFRTETSLHSHGGMAQSFSTGNKQGDWSYALHGLYFQEEGQEYTLQQKYGEPVKTEDGRQLNHLAVDLHHGNAFFRADRFEHDFDPFVLYDLPAPENDKRFFAQGSTRTLSFGYEFPLSRGSLLIDFQYSQFSGRHSGLLLEKEGLASIIASEPPEEATSEEVYQGIITLFPRGWSFGTYFKEERGALNLQWLYHLGDSHVLEGGISLINETLEESGALVNFWEDVLDDNLIKVQLISKQTREIEGIYFQDHFLITSAISAYFGARIDQYSNFGKKIDDSTPLGVIFNPRMGIVFRLPHQQVIKFLHGSAFRAPSFAEQFEFDLTTSTTQENPLNPETTRVTEAAYLLGLSSTYKLKLNVYQSKTEDVIIAVGEGKPQNLASFENQGIEAEFRADFRPQHYLSTNFSYVDQSLSDGPIDSINNTLIAQRIFNIVYNVPYGLWLNLNTSLSYLSPRKYDVYPDRYVPAVTTGNMNLIVHPPYSRVWEIFAGVHNISDALHRSLVIANDQVEPKQYAPELPRPSEEINHIPSRGREFRLGLRLHF